MSASMSLYAALEILVALPAVGFSVYLLIATLCSWRPALPPRSSRRLAFEIIVPAHNEEAGIARTVASVRAVDWPADRFRVRVIADNCEDDTAGTARLAGALVSERTEPTQRGKGYALAFAFEAVLSEAWADAVLVVDADSTVSANVLEACAARIERGAQAVQTDYGVLNPQAGWRTRLITIAFGAFHIVRSRARENLGLSCGIRGNGWCVTRALLGRLPYRSFSLTEDIEYGIDLGLGGLRVEYADEAHTLGEMVTGAGAADKQRARWEGGRFGLIRAQTGRLLAAAVRQGSPVCLDLALDLAVLPLSYIVLSIAALALVGLGGLLLGPGLWFGLSLAAACTACVVLYVLRGWQLSGVGWRGLVDLARAPFFVFWKLIVLLRGGRTGEWVRTERERS